MTVSLKYLYSLLLCPDCRLLNCSHIQLIAFVLKAFLGVYYLSA